MATAENQALPPRHVATESVLSDDFASSWRSSTWEALFAESGDEMQPNHGGGGGGGDDRYVSDGDDDDYFPARVTISDEEPWQSSVYSRGSRRRVFSDQFSPKHSRRKDQDPPEPIQSPPFLKMTELQEIRAALQRQEDKIEKLENENRILRRRLERRSTSDSVGSNTPSLPPSIRLLREPRRRLGGLDLRRTSTSSDHLRGATKGAKFVAEFVDLIELDAGHHNLLCFIMDKYHFGKRSPR